MSECGWLVARVGGRTAHSIIKSYVALAAEALQECERAAAHDEEINEVISWPEKGPK